MPGKKGWTKHKKTLRAARQVRNGWLRLLLCAPVSSRFSDEMSRTVPARLFRLIPVLLAMLPNLVLAETLTGVASVVDGDTLEIHGERIRLYGIDAPQSAQRCKKLDGSQWRCGQRAAFALADRIGRQTVRCKGNERDRYGHLIAICYHKGQDLNAWMVRQGWALVYRRYSRDYIGQEQQAKVSRAGIWSGAFIVPWEWRSHRRGEDAANDKDYPDFDHQGEAGRFTQPR